MELKRHIVKGETYNGEEICGGFAYYDADEVDAVLAEKDKEIRRLKRALYKACANWAAVKACLLAYVGIKILAKKWDRMYDKCRAMAKRYGEG